MKGRKRKPTKLRLLQGNPGRVAINANEPQPEALPEGIEPPHYLHKRAREIWRELTPMLARIGLLTESDIRTIARYCVQFDQWLKAKTKVDRLGLTYEGKVQGGGTRIFKRPELAIMQQLSDSLLKIEQEFGLTPAARTRVEVNLPKTGGHDDTDELDKLIYGK